MQARLTKKRQRRVVYHCQPRGAFRLQNISSARASARKHERRAAAGIFFHSSLFYRHKYLPAQLTRASTLNNLLDKPGSKVESVRPLHPPPGIRLRVYIFMAKDSALSYSLLVDSHRSSPHHTLSRFQRHRHEQKSHIN